MEKILGKWKSDRSKDVGVDEYLKKSGISDDIIQKNTEETTWELSKEGDKIKSVLHAVALGVTTQTFRLGEPFDFQSPAGNVKAVSTFVGKVFKEHYESDQGLTFDTIREINGNEMKAVTTSVIGKMEQYMYRC